MNSVLRPDELLTLALANPIERRNLKSASELSSTPSKCGSLVRRGFLSSFDQSDHVRGERRITYKLYELTSAGQKMLEKHNRFK